MRFLMQKDDGKTLTYPAFYDLDGTTVLVAAGKAMFNHLRGWCTQRIEQDQPIKLARLLKHKTLYPTNFDR